MGENRTNPLTVMLFIAQMVCIAGIVVYTVKTIRQPSREVHAEIASAFKRSVDSRPNHDGSIRGREGWVAEDFFGDPDVIRAANTILAQDNDALQTLIDAGLDVNHDGKAGMTLLFWALITDNHPAFERLLQAGADPDKRLAGSIIPRRIALVFARNDTVLFASLKISRADFFLSALKYTDQVNQRDWGNRTMLHACTTDHLIHERTCIQVLQPLIDAGIDLDARDRYGCTAAYHAVDENPALCLQLLQAGADPEISSQGGDSLADRLSHSIERFRKQGLTQRLAEAERVRQWLDANQKGKPEPE